MRIAVVRPSGEGFRSALFDEEICLSFEGGCEETARWLFEQSPERLGILALHGGPNHFRISPLNKELIDEVEPFSGDLTLAKRALEEPLSKRTFLLFDTGFYHTLPLESSVLGIPKYLKDKGIRKYGLKGFAMESIAHFGKPEGRSVLLYLGPTTTATAVVNGAAKDTSGLLLSSTASGPLEPWIFKHINQDPSKLVEALMHEGGMLAISGISGSMEELTKEAPHHLGAMLAIETYALEVKKAVASLTASLGGIDTLVFSGPFGAQYPLLRKEITGGLDLLGIELDVRKNEANDADCGAGSISVRIIPSREEEMMAKHVASAHFP